MEDVVLHHQSGSADGLRSLLERTEKLLETFPCRPPPVFMPWFPSAAAGPRRQIRPAKPAPVITSAGESVITEDGPHTRKSGNQRHKPKAGSLAAKRRLDRLLSESPPEKTQRSEEAVCVSETPKLLLPPPLRHRAEGAISPQKHKDGAFRASPLERSWSAAMPRGVPPQKSLSQLFDRVVSAHRLHLRQRAKWVIREHNCGAAQDIEQVWRTLSRSVRRAGMPTCNANIQRDRAEIWVFCDVLYSEQVGRLLKAELQLTGTIVLSVHRQGNVFSM
ncbi:shieldin complex subunit 3 [Scophthalmus maximus]|uniref:shieldin complex subunit 3 n=1 Tax=Scophthalmus maximus TaxID=52904 RepID=UPI000F340C3F|nr:shieldin complex subunit 3 [Scophthalmus maximus]XP_035496390.1 shieldin complex subunit 3 [Scophthalmus maximus]